MTELCRTCHGTGSTTEQPRLYGDGAITSACEDCNGRGWFGKTGLSRSAMAAMHEAERVAIWQEEQYAVHAWHSSLRRYESKEELIGKRDE